MAEKIIPLSKQYKAGDKVFSEVVLREPTYKEIYMDGRGKPEEWQRTRSGPVLVSYPEVVDGYLQVLIEEPGYEFIGGLAAVDALKLDAAVCDFFLDGSAQKTQSTGSSSAPGSTSDESK